MDLRKCVLKELYSTEVDYVNDLTFVIEMYVKPLRDREDLLSRDQIPHIFSNIELLRSVNAELLTQLRRCWSKQSELAGTEITGFGQIILEHADRLKVYDQYCNNHPSAVEALTKCKAENPRFSSLLDSRTKDNFPIDLRDFLIKPVQRICKYPLLIREILKHTPEDHSDYPPLIQTQDKLNAVARQINQKRREHENRTKILEIEKLVEGLTKLPGGRLLVPQRVFYHEGVLSKVNPKGVIQSRHFYLFSDILIWTKKNMGGGRSTFKGMLPLDLAVCRTCPDDEKKKIKFAFQIIRVDTKKIYTLMAENDEDKARWMKDVERIINRHLGVVEDDPDPFLASVSESTASSSSSSNRPSSGEFQAFSSTLTKTHSGTFVKATSPLAKVSSPLSKSATPSKNASADALALYLQQLEELEELFQAERQRRIQLEELCDLLMHKVLELEQQRRT